MSKIKTSIIDRNGKATHVWKNPDVPGGNKSFDRLGNVVTQFVPIAAPSSMSDFNGIIYSADSATLSTKDGRMVYVSIPELGALANKLGEYPVEWGAPNVNTLSLISNDLQAGWEGKIFVIEDKRLGRITLDDSEVYLLNSSVNLYMQTARDIDGYTSTHGLVDIVRSGVSDRDENYFVTLGKDSMLTTYISDSGLSDGDFGGNDRDEVTFYRDAESGDTAVKIQVSYSDDVDISDHLDSLGEDEHTDFIQSVNDTLAEIDPRLVANFDSPEDVTILFNDVHDTSTQHENGSISFSTSNALHDYSQPEHVALMNKAWTAFRSKVDY